MAVSSLGTQNLQELGRTLHTALDRNGDQKLDVTEFTSFLTGLLNSANQSTTGLATTSPYLPPTTSSPNPVSTVPISTPKTVSDAVTFSDWRKYIWGQNQSAKYEYMPVDPPNVQVSSEGYTQGPYRHQLEGFNYDKMDPNHQDGMVLKYVAARVFEQIDVYAPDAADQAANIFNQLGIPAKVVAFDQIDFQNGENPIDVIRGADDPTSGESRGWQWLNT